MSHPGSIVVGMNSKRRTGYALSDLARQIARRVQQERELSELAPPSPWHVAEVIPFFAPDEAPPPPTEKRPLAA